MAKRPRPAVLFVLDGFGVAPDSEGNAITRAKKPTFDLLTSRYPCMTLQSSGETVGLMWGEMGNSEVGHLTIGAGRVYYQALPRIEQAIADKSFFSNASFLRACEQVKKTGGTLHLMGLLSSGKVHASDVHCHALLQLAKEQNVKDVAVHAFLDGRDTLYNAGMDFLSALLQKMSDLGVGKLASVSGRYFAMDRDHRWERVQRAYQTIVNGVSETTSQDILETVRASYAKEVYDEEFPPTVMTKRGKPVAQVKEGDAVIFFNFRPDRARQLTQALAVPTFSGFERPLLQNVHIVTLMEYEAGLPVDVAYPPKILTNTLAEVLSNNGLVQLHIAETEKYAHVTFFMNGTREQPFPNEDRAIIPSPSVASYDQTPAMSAITLTDRIVKEVKTGNYDVIIANFANPDMVGHTGNLEATVQAIEAVDACIGRVVTEVLAKDGVVLITADHGNAEEVRNLQTGDMDKEHSTNAVPFWVIGKQFEGQQGPSGDVPGGDLSLLPPVGMLADVAPTLLKILDIPQPPEMTGTPLL